MFKKENIWVIPILLVAFWCSATASPVHAEDTSLQSQILSHAGQSYRGAQDPKYPTYDRALRGYVVERINTRFGIKLDPKAYSGFKLLEIEAVFKCKKSDEPFDILLKMVCQSP